MARLRKPFKPRKTHKYVGLHIGTQACWWLGISIALNFTTLFIPDTIQSGIVSIAGSGIIFVLSHKHGKNCKWI